MCIRDSPKYALLMMDILINTYDTMAKILLVEDEINIASFIERGLREFGHEVYVAYDGAAGWELTQDVYKRQ